MKRFTFLKIASLVFLLFSTQSMALDKGDTIPLEIQKKLHLNKDKLYVIDFFASWCHSCKKELPHLQKIYRKNGINMIGVDADENIYQGKKFVKKLKVTFDVIYDKKQTIINTFAPLGFPSLYFVKNGKILKVITGAVHNIDKIIINDVKRLK